MKEKEYYGGGLPSRGHSPVYKMHKYFARRPHNVFYSLIEHYSEAGEIVFDPFGGGGVTVIEGLTSNRRVISCDVNPIASFIQYCQVLDVAPVKFMEVAADINLKVLNRFKNNLFTECSGCSSDAHVRWYEHAYIVDCPYCNSETSLENENIVKGENGKAKAGSYVCCNCNKTFQAVSVQRKSSKLLNIKFKCSECGTHATKVPSRNDIERFRFFEINQQTLIDELGLQIPEDDIPEYWDRQQEDCLHRKGFRKFKDLFTKRNLIISAYYFKCLDSLKGKISDELYLFTLFNISSLLRYTNNMSFSTSSWMDGRPVAWAKHAYWLPNQFIEVNPFEYFENRIKAALLGLKDQKSRFKGKLPAKSVSSFLHEEKDYFITCTDSSKIELPENSVDVVITDPPYGSNVQYSELCAFWYVWIKDRIEFKTNDFFFQEEAVVHRKTKAKNYSKSFGSYTQKLNEVFTKCYQVLKPNGYLVFTFNNKNIKAWFSVIKAAIDSGFYLDPEGIVYQEPIDAYRDTAHQRYDGTPQGDFIYSFKKTGYRTDFKCVPTTVEQCISETLNDFIEKGKSFNLEEFMVLLYAKSTFSFIYRIMNGEDGDKVFSDFSSSYALEKINADNRVVSKDNYWKPQSKKYADKD